MIRPSTSPARGPQRRGVTLLEMLVVVALVVLMMVILASIFQAATGAISSSRTNAELDASLRFLDITLRADLGNVTATMTPPLDPARKLGYFEYGENAPADLQGEDTDDYLAFTTRAPEGQSFTGRVWIAQNPSGIPPVNFATQPVTITSQVAEVIYFLRNGNLYRRVLLVVPERRGSLTRFGVDPRPGAAPRPGIFYPNMFNNFNSSWLSVDDISARPAIDPNNGGTYLYPPIANDLGDLTNRQHRFARQRSGDDFWNVVTGARNRDGIIDDGNGDGIPDYYSTLTFSQVQKASATSDLTAGNSPSDISKFEHQLMNEDGVSMPGAGGRGFSRLAPTTDLYAFPFVYPGMYSKAETSSINGSVGWLHALDTRTTAGVAPSGAIFNHSPLEFGDSLPIPSSSSANPQEFQTWWGFPTWRETASVVWRDPIFSPTGPFVAGGEGQQVPGLRPFDQTATIPVSAANLLPPLGTPPLGSFTSAYPAPYGSDGAGYPPFGAGFPPGFNTPIQVWEDDLIMTGVRSFDVKAFDQNAQVYSYNNLVGGPVTPTTPVYNAGYYDLGYASTDYFRAFGSSATGLGLLTGTPQQIMDGNQNPQGFGHEGRMPPNPNDLRVDPQRPLIKNSAGGVDPNYLGDSNPGLQRIRRVWDTWSTDYTTAPAVDVNLRGSPILPFPLDRPIYPSYPPPYPQPLRGIQVQIRVVDPKNEKVKVLTIRQDFSDKL